jgi:hypothetical protein
MRKAELGTSRSVRAHPVWTRALVLTFLLVPLIPGPDAPAQDTHEMPPPGRSQPATRPAPSAPGKATEPRSFVIVTAGRLTVQVQDRPLSWVLDQIGREARVAINPAPGIGTQRVSLQLRDVPLEEGLRQLLTNQDAFFFYEAAEKGPPTLKALWLYPRGQGRGLAPVPAEAWASTAELENRVADPDPNQRAKVLEALIERKRDQAQETILWALRDADDGVRTRVLYAALQAGVKLPPEVRMHLAPGDPKPEVRFLALEGLAGDPNEAEIAQQALSDPSPHLQNKAQEILRRLQRASRAPAPPGQ